MISRIGITVFCGVALACFSQPTNSRVRTSAAVENYTVSFFSDEGYPRVRVEGGTAELADPEKILLTDMHLELYSGGADRTVETTMVAPVAILERTPEIVSGPGTVRLSRNDLELTGADWIYHHRDQRVQVRRDARVVFKMPLEGLLE